MLASMDTSDTAGRLLTARQVAQLLGYSTRTVRRLVLAGALPEPVRLLGPTAHPRWRAADVDAWLRRTA